MEHQEYFNYVLIEKNKEDFFQCQGDDISYTFNFAKDLNIDFGKLVNHVYFCFKENLQLKFRYIDTVNFEEIKGERDLNSFVQLNNKDGSIFITSDIPMYWEDNVENIISQILLPMGCKISVFKNVGLPNPLSIVLRFYFNLFSNNLVSVKSKGTYQPELYDFKIGARLNRAIVKSCILRVLLEYKEKVEIEFDSNIGRLSGFDEFGFTNKTDFLFNQV